MATKLLFWAAALLITAGCSVPGRLYTNTTEPYTKNFDLTPVGTKTLVLKDYRLKEPISGYSISAEWTTDYILTAAGRAGITNVYYADLHTFALFLGIYKRKELIIYGD